MYKLSLQIYINRGYTNSGDESLQKPIGKATPNRLPPLGMISCHTTSIS